MILQSASQISIEMTSFFLLADSFLEANR